ncbi:hypothetical protein [Vandammella animalimorsus]|uniref:hypothetical protein n=1 Tax=Vandammella animalimorsus TaxID=2029117 RepID=UPI001178AC08|nr:hypothetical protein [Vandammella animalimorsus]
MAVELLVVDGKTVPQPGSVATWAAGLSACPQTPRATPGVVDMLSVAAVFSVRTRFAGPISTPPCPRHGARSGARRLGGQEKQAFIFQIVQNNINAYSHLYF